jgi:hypothetical protein
VNDSRTPTRRRESKRRRRTGQKTFPVLLDDVAEGFRDRREGWDPTFPYRTALANWPDEWRERWGHRANSLEEEGLSWQDAEVRAFAEIQGERRVVIPLGPASSEAPVATRN